MTTPPIAPPPVLEWTQDEAAAFARARAEAKGVVIDFYASWATPCIEIDRWLATRGAYEVIAPHFVALRFDVTNDSNEASKQRERYHAAALPTLLFVDASGQVLERVPRLLEPDELHDIARAASAKLRHR